MSKHICLNPNCGKTFTIPDYRKYKKLFCSPECSNSRGPRSKKFKNNLSKLFTKKRSIIICENEKCKKGFKCDKPYRERKARFCSKKCSNSSNWQKETGRLGGLASSKIQSENRRSKNEIEFAEMCKLYFDNVKTNEAIFNGWDADVIIEDYKIAVLWNGKWHYKKITKKHSVKQVQNRDKIKIKEIIKCGYKPYVIKDMGKYDPVFVVKEFRKLYNRYNVLILDI